MKQDQYLGERIVVFLDFSSNIHWGEMARIQLKTINLVLRVGFWTYSCRVPPVKTDFCSLTVSVVCSLDMTGKPLSVEKEVLMEMSEAAKHKTSVASTCEGGDCINTGSNTAEPLSTEQKKRLSSDCSALVKQRVSDDDDSESECLATGMTTIQLEI